MVIGNLVIARSNGNTTIDYRLSAVGAGYGFMYPGQVLVIWDTFS